MGAFVGSQPSPEAAWGRDLLRNERGFLRIGTIGAGPTPPTPPEFFVSATGGTGAGTITDPWSLAHALSGAGGAVTPGATVGLLGGIYPNVFFRPTVAGTATQPIVFRALDGARVQIQVQNLTFVLDSCPYVWFWGVEIYYAGWTTRISAQEGSFPTDIPQPTIANRSTGMKYIYCHLHDLTGFGFDIETDGGCECYGCFSYNHGWQGPDRGHGHGFYGQNTTGAQTVTGLVSAWNFGKGAQFFGQDGDVNGYTVSYSAFQGNADGGFDLHSINGQMIGNVLHHLRFFTAPDGSGSVQLGLLDAGSTTKGDLIATDLYSADLVHVGRFATLEFRRNTMLQWENFRLTTALASGSGYPAYTWDENAYVQRDTAFDGFSTIRPASNTLDPYATWRTNSGYDAASTYALNATGRPATTVVFVDPIDAYEPGRANISIFNWEGLGSVNVNVLSVLQVGDPYTVWSYSNPYGAPVASGVVPVGGVIAVPVTAIAPPARIGGSPGTTTSPLYDTFLLRRMTSLPALEVLEPFTGDGALSGSWTQQGTGTPIVRVAGQGAMGGGGLAAMAYWNADVFAADQYSEVVVKDRGAAGKYYGPVARSSGIGEANQNGYIAFDNISPGNVELWKVVAGTFTQLKVITQVVVANDVLRIEVQGTTIVVKLNGTQIGTSTSDSSLATGSAGVYILDASTRVDDWRAGNL
jgi:hypothetical protein